MMFCEGKLGLFVSSDWRSRSNITLVLINISYFPEASPMRSMSLNSLEPPHRSPIAIVYLDTPTPMPFDVGLGFAHYVDPMAVILPHLNTRFFVEGTSKVTLIYSGNSSKYYLKLTRPSWLLPHTPRIRHGDLFSSLGWIYASRNHFNSLQET